MMADRSDVLELLRIADLAKEWPNLRPLHDHAMQALQKAADEHAAVAKKASEEAKKAKEAEEAKKAEEAAKSQAETKTGAASPPAASASATQAKDDENDKPSRYTPTRR